VTAPLVAPDLRDGPVGLRELRDDDAPRFASALQDPGVFDGAYSGNLAADEAAVLAYIRDMRPLAASGERILLTITGEGDAMAGLGMLFGFNERNRDCEIGFWLHPDARGTGVGTRAVRLLSGWAMHALGVERVYAMTRPDNAGSRALLERAGFVLDGTLRGSERTADGERRDSVSYTILYTDDQAPPDPRKT
jgi:RimJ/RimL family protein N-acetyltransferase